MAFAALVVDLTAKLTNLQQGMDRAVKIAEDSGKKIEKAFSFGNAARAGAGFFAAQLGLESLREAAVKIKDLSDEWTRVRVLIQNVTSGIEEAAFAQDKLYKAAQATRQNFGELARSYASFARNADQLNISSEEAVELQTTVAQAIALSGARADSAASALVQFGQGIAAGVLRGEELNSVLEQTPKLAKALADGLGVPIGQLIKMGKEGELTADRIIQALKKVAPQMQAEFDKVTPTIADAFVAVNNSIGNMLAGVNRIIPVADTLANILIGAAGAIDKIAGMLRMTGSNSTQVAVNEAQRAREQARLLEPFTSEEFLAQQFRRANPNMVVDVEAIREQARINREQRNALLQKAAELEAQLDAGGLQPSGVPIPSMAEADAAAARRRQEAEVERQKIFARIFLQNRGISNAFQKDVEELQKAFEGRDFNDQATRDEYNKEYRALLERSGFFPKSRTTKQDDPLDAVLRVAERKWEELDKLREKVLDSIDPLRELKRELADIDRLAALGESGGGISQDAAAQARAQIESKIADAARQRLLQVEPLTEVREELDKYLDGLRIEVDLLGLTDAEREARLKLLDYEAKGLERGSAEWNRYRQAIESAQKIKRLSELDQMKGGMFDSRTADIQLLTERLQGQLDTADMYGLDPQKFQQAYIAAVQGVLGTTNVIKDEAFKLGEAFQSAFEKAVVGGEKFSDVLRALGQDIASLILRQQFTAPLAGAINSGLKEAFGGKTFFEMLFGGAAGRATGGPVTAGTPYWVGERGVPELFVPGQSGTIVPLEKMRRGGDSVVINNTFAGGMAPMDVANMINVAVAQAEQRLVARQQRMR